MPRLPVQETGKPRALGAIGGAKIVGVAAVGQVTVTTAVLLFALPQLLVAFAQNLNVPAAVNGPGS